MSAGIVTRFSVEEDVTFAGSRRGHTTPVSSVFEFTAEVQGCATRSAALQAIIRKAQAELDDQPPAVR